MKVPERVADLIGQLAGTGGAGTGFEPALTRQFARVHNWHLHWRATRFAEPLSPLPSGAFRVGEFGGHDARHRQPVVLNQIWTGQRPAQPSE